MVYIENEGALFRGPARGVPQEVWSASQGKFIPYAGAAQERSIEWGEVISEQEAQELAGGKLPAAEGEEAAPGAEEAPVKAE